MTCLYCLSVALSYTIFCPLSCCLDDDPLQPVTSDETVSVGGTVTLTCRVAESDNSSLQWSNTAQQTLYFGEKRGEREGGMERDMGSRDNNKLFAFPCQIHFLEKWIVVWITFNGNIFFKSRNCGDDVDIRDQGSQGQGSHVVRSRLLKQSVMAWERLWLKYWKNLLFPTLLSFKSSRPYSMFKTIFTLHYFALNFPSRYALRHLE